ncbi:MAG: outer membrane protein assembly factor BamE [Pseudomonadales bacterium]|jgi:outer membrane protein assembly factor BamE
MRMLLLTAVFASLILSGCSLKRPRLPRVHKLTVQQGNVINQDMIDKLKPGMTRSQVAFIMGEPVMRDSFNDDRWDYVYSIELPGVFSTSQTVSLYFVDDQLAYFTGDMVPSRFKEQVDAGKADTAETPSSTDASPSADASPSGDAQPSAAGSG